MHHALSQVAPLGGAGVVSRRLPHAAGYCYLTFDDGPHPQWTRAVLDALAAAEMRASFFVIGRLAAASGPLLREAHAAGHTVGNHGLNHRHPWTLSRTRARDEVRDGAAAIAEVIGTRPEWFRPPHGRLSPAVIDAARSEGQQIALWSVSAIDWGPLASPHTILQRLQRIRSGDIALLHDGPLRHNRPDITSRILPSLLALLNREGPISAALPSIATMPA